LNKVDPLGLRPQEPLEQDCAAGEAATGTPGNPSITEPVNGPLCRPVVDYDPLGDLLRCKTPWGEGSGLGGQAILFVFQACIVSVSPVPRGIEIEAANAALMVLLAGASIEAPCATSFLGLGVACLHSVSIDRPLGFVVNDRAGAYTQGHFVFCRQRCHDEPLLLEHELVHVRQYETIPTFAELYIAVSAVVSATGGDPDCDNPFEREAYEVNDPERCP
jgi:hypothetical protein